MHDLTKLGPIEFYDHHAWMLEEIILFAGLLMKLYPTNSFSELK